MIPYLKLDEVKHNHQVEKLLPQDIAYQYHALPVSREGNQVIVAISYPEDETVMSVVSSAIGTPVSFVWSDIGEIDQRLAEIWHHSTNEVLNLLLWSSSGGDQCRAQFAEGVAELINARLYHVDSQQFVTNPLEGLQQSIEEYQPNLVVLDDLGDLSRGSRLWQTVSRRLISSVLNSLLITNQPRWPLQNLLLIMNEADPVEDPALEWISLLAKASHASVKILVPLPQVPLMFGDTICHSIPCLLKSHDPLGRKVQWIADHFAHLGIEGTFRLRQGDSESQIWSEILISDPDLVVISAESQSLSRRILTKDTINSLMKHADCPVIFAKGK